MQGKERENFSNTTKQTGDVKKKNGKGNSGGKGKQRNIKNEHDQKQKKKPKQNDDEETKTSEVKKIQDRDCINILLLSETGVGKSTFINAIANYLTHKNFEVAEKEKLRILIPSKFQVAVKNGKMHKVSVGETDKNEFLSSGESATQDVKSYIFPVGKKDPNIRLIDTPGMGDTRGPEQDQKNCDYILNYISQLKELHSICCLFKPVNTRNTIYFQYCVSEILSRLDKSASRNIVFIFTNTRGSNYSSGETFDVLKKNLDDIQKKNNVQIPLDVNKNIFCFDNEAFRYLAAFHDGAKFDGTDRERYKESWKKSCTQFWK